MSPGFIFLFQNERAIHYHTCKDLKRIGVRNGIFTHLSESRGLGRGVGVAEWESRSGSRGVEIAEWEWRFRVMQRQLRNGSYGKVWVRLWPAAGF